MQVRAAGAVLIAAAAWLLYVRARRKTRSSAAAPTPFRRRVSLAAADVPPALTVQDYIDVESAEQRGFEHVGYLREAASVAAAVAGIERYALRCLQQSAARLRADPMMSREVELTSGSATSPRFSGICAIGQSRLLLPSAETTFAPERMLGSTDSKPLAGTSNHLVMLEEGAVVEGGTLDVRHGSIHLGAGAVVEPGALVRGPAVVGARTVLRRGAYLRGAVVLGGGGTFGCELKNVLACDGCECPHHGYVGDSLLGHRAHLGCGATTANFPLFPSSTLAIDLPAAQGDGELLRYELGLRKFGAVIGDGSQLGCGCVTEPGCLIAADTHAYPLCRLPRGVYGPREILKRAPGVVRAPLRAASAPSP
jgi:hypothetical protein